MKLFIIILLSITAFSSCSSIYDPITGGADDTPNFIKGVVLDYNNSPVSNAEITLRNISFENSQIVTNQEITILSNNNGEYVFDNDIVHTKYALTASSENKSKALGRVEVANKSLVIDAFSLENRTTITGRVLNSNNATVLIAGVYQGVQTDINGVYVLEDIAPGEYDLTFISDSIVNFLPIVVTPGRDTVFIRDIEISTDSQRGYSFFNTESTPSFSTTPVVYELGNEPDWYQGRDFEMVRYFSPSQSGDYREIDSSNNYKLLLDNFESSSFSAAGVRNFFDDSFYDGNSGVIQNITHNDLSNAIKTSEKGSKILELDFVLDSELEYAHAGIAFEFKTKREFVDMSNLTSVSFMIKGNSKPVRFEFVSKAGIQFEELDENWGHFGKTITPEPDWQRVEIPISDFEPLPDSRFATDDFLWSGVNSEITSFNILAERMPGDTISVSIDEIYLHGVTSETLF